MKLLSSIGLILLVGYIAGFLANRIKLPSLVGMILGGIILGTSVLNIISPKVLEISSDIKSMALIVILIRSGLALDINKVKQVGKSAVLLSFIPAIVEIVVFVFLGQIILKLPFVQSLILGTVIAAVSPAIIIPRMLKIQSEGYGEKRHIPELVMVGSSMDDILVLILFSVSINLYFNADVNFIEFVKIPVSIIFGGFFGYLVGRIFIFIFNKHIISDTVKIILMLSVSFIFYGMESFINEYIPISILVSIIVMAVVIFNCNKVVAERLAIRYKKIWMVAEIFLFVLIGATVDINIIVEGGLYAVGLIFIALFFRIISVSICLINTNFTVKEKIFIGFSYMPKATVQAAIGGIPLSLGVANGDLILAVAVVAIIITAPLGGILIDSSYKKLLEKG